MSRVSLRDELANLARALEALRLLVDELRHDQLATERDRERVPHVVSAVVGLAIARLRLLQHVIGGSLNPQLLAEEFNEAVARSEVEGEDLIVQEWDAGRRLEAASAELSRARRSAQRKKP